uniref:Uncharacterized protein n=1 Tax=Aegilops tauschii TaxID=37682 RepID=M8BY94_AEGTA
MAVVAPTKGKGNGNLQGKEGEILTGYEFRDYGKLQRLPEGLTKLKRLQIRECPVAAQGHPPEPSARISDQALYVRQISAQDGLTSSLWKLEVFIDISEELKRKCRKLKGTIPIIEGYN